MLWASINSSDEVNTRTYIHKVRKVRVCVPRAPTVDYETDAALSVLQTTAASSGVATGARSDQDTSKLRASGGATLARRGSVWRASPRANKASAIDGATSIKSKRASCRAASSSMSRRAPLSAAHDDRETKECDAVTVKTHAGPKSTRETCEITVGLEGSCSLRTRCSSNQYVCNNASVIQPAAERKQSLATDSTARFRAPRRAQDNGVARARWASGPWCDSRLSVSCKGERVQRNRAASKGHSESATDDPTQAAMA
eukprot:3519554-Pleurochrysis_carterae.AAC.3